MSAEPVASIIIPSYRGVDRLPALLKSLARQSPETPVFEVIVVVDGIDDGSVALVENETRIDARTVLFPENRGRVAALNAGFSAAKGEVLIRCDDDLVVPSGYVDAHVGAHTGSTPIGVVGPTRDVHKTSAYARAYGLDAAEKSFAYVLGRPPEERWRLWAASCSLTKRTWDEIGPYDERYRGYGWEDVDYGYRLHRAGVPIEIAADATAEHHGPASSAQARALKALDSGTARAAFQETHPEAPIGRPTSGGGVWGACVRVFAQVHNTRARVRRSAGRVDLVLPRVPRAVGRKLVALVVEGAGLAGMRAATSGRPDHR